MKACFFVTGIVRVGGRCSDKLKCCSLKVRRKEATANEQTPRRISTALRNVRDELRDLKKNWISRALHRCTEILEKRNSFFSCTKEVYVRMSCQVV